jgi:hypothetical protein
LLYRDKVKEDREKFQGMNVDKIKRPGPPPFYLGLYFELQRWPGSLLVEGGLYDQPYWVWDMIDLAGKVYQEYA